MTIESINVKPITDEMVDTYKTAFQVYLDALPAKAPTNFSWNATKAGLEAVFRTIEPLDEATKQKLREALRFSASRSVLTSEDERRILSALSHSPVEQESGAGALVRLGTAVLSEAPVEATQFMGVTLSEIRDALAPIAHTFHIDPVSSESVRDDVEGTPSPAAHVVGISDDDLMQANLHSFIETAAKAADAAVYEAMRSEIFDPSIPDNVAEYVGNAVRAAFPKETSNV
jgi:hypothetical protein